MSCGAGLKGPGYLRGAPAGLGLLPTGSEALGRRPGAAGARREAERSCRFPSGRGLFPTRAGPAAFLCQGVLPAL